MQGRLYLLAQSFAMPFVLILTLFTCSCQFGAKQGETDEVMSSGEKVTIPEASPEDVPNPDENNDLSSADTAAADLAASEEDVYDNCVKQSFEELPFWVEGSSVVFTQLMNRCFTTEGTRGYRSDSTWMAMGFPCAGGGGRIDVTGSYYAPRVVSFVLSTSCPLTAPGASEVDSQVRAKLGLAESAKSLAFNPFAVQYWEVPATGDADVGFVVDLRSVEARQRLWKNFYEHKEPIQVKLYGRENAWISGNYFYTVDAQLVYEARTSFRLEVKKVRPLGRQEFSDVRVRCESLMPRRNCDHVF